MLVLLGTAVAAANRVQEGWGRDDVRRLPSSCAPRPPAGAVIGAGTPGKPGLPSAEELTTGKIKATGMAVRASDWSAELGERQGQLEGVALSNNPDLGDTSTGVPANSVGGRVAELTSVRTTYAAGVSVLEQAALAFGDASPPTPTSRGRGGPADRATQAAQGQGGGWDPRAAVQLAQSHATGQGLVRRGQLPSRARTATRGGRPRCGGGATTGD